MTNEIEKEEAPEPEIKLSPCTRKILGFIKRSNKLNKLVGSREINIYLKRAKASCKTSKKPLKNLCKAGLLKKDIQPKRLEGGVRKPARGVYIITTKGKEVISNK